MRLLFDTSILVEIDRQNEQVVTLLKKWVQEGKELVISTITVAEILTGSYLHRDIRTAVLTAKEVLNQFTWLELDGEIAETTAKLYAYLLLEKKEKSIEYPDVLIAATALAHNCDAIITLNKKDFCLFPHIKEKIYTPNEFEKRKNL